MNFSFSESAGPNADTQGVRLMFDKGSDVPISNTKQTPQIALHLNKNDYASSKEQSELTSPMKVL